MKLSIFKEETWVLALGAIFAVFMLILLLPLTAVNKKTEGFMVKVDYGNGTEKKFRGSLQWSRTAWDTLQQASAHSLLDVDVAEGFHPNSIDQKENGEEGKHWVLYINNKRTFASPIEVKINSGDEVLWRFE